MIYEINQKFKIYTFGILVIEVVENVDNFIKNLDNPHYMIFESFFVCLFVLWITF